jgi:tetratricopeptide (TPR) repeat protein
LGLANGYRAQRDFKKAVEYHRKAANAYHGLSNGQREAICFGDLARDYFDLGNPDQALASLVEARGIAKDTTPFNRYLVNYLLGDLYRTEGQFEKALASYSYLRKFPIDALKIDQSFVRQITMTPQDTTIVSAIISMGRSLNLRVVAEGVETFGELEFLQAHQCDEAQGYYFSRPVPPEQFAKLLETGIRETIVA